MNKLMKVALLVMALCLLLTGCQDLPSINVPFENPFDLPFDIPFLHHHVWQDATCTTPKTCACGETEGEALGHKPGAAATCTADQTCTVCKAVLNKATGHTEETLAAKAPTCTATGLTAGKKCTVCGTTTVAQKVVPANGHTEETLAAVAPTCTGTGLTEGKKCTVCGTDTVVQTVVPANGHKDENEDYECDVCETDLCTDHTEETVPAVAPTCTGTGLTEGKKCSICGDIIVAQEIVAANGHSYSATVTAPTCTAAGYTTYTCSGCGDTYTADEVAATDHADENKDYKCDTCSTKVLPADGTTLTIPEALAIAKLQSHNTYTTQKYYITGIVTGLYNTEYGNFYIKDADGNQICIYGLYSADGETRYDAMSYKPVNGDEVTVYTVLGAYNTTYQGKNAWLDEVVAHEHDYKAVVTEPTCTKDGYTTHTCTICNDYYTDSKTDALGHTTDNGTCENCGQTFGGDAPAYETFTADFNTVADTNTNYVTSTTTSGWKATNCAVMGGGTSDSNPKFKVFGDASTRAFTLNGKTSAKGSIVSPTLTGGISAITFNYTNCFSESNGVDITITIKQNGAAVATKQLDNNSVTKLTAYTFEWKLETAISGDFTIEITNNSPSNNTGNKDRVSIWNLQWTNNPA